MNTNKERKLILIRGLPGSGKTTKAKALAAEYQDRNLTTSIRTTDDLFMVDGVYRFNPKFLHENHLRNQELVERDMKYRVDVIIVPNCSIKRAHLIPYEDIAEKYDYEVTEILVGNFDDNSILEYWERSLHGVPLETIRRMARGFEE